MKKIKMYGERNTNTNYMSKLLHLNLDAYEIPGTVPKFMHSVQRLLPGREMARDIYFKLSFAHNLGWKHAKVLPKDDLIKYPLAQEVSLFLTITKNPYSWLLSLHRRPYHQYNEGKISFEAFLNTPWKTVGRDMADSQRNPIELWNIKNKSYLDLDPENTLHTTSESIFLDPAQVVSQISEKSNISKKSDTFINYDRSTKEQGKSSDYYRDYYLNNRWKDELSSEAIKTINRFVDKELVSYFGYEIL